ncbi:MAG: hypothetical protein ABJB85_03980 [Nitrososphaerota archaeon]
MKFDVEGVHYDQTELDNGVTSAMSVISIPHVSIPTCPKRIVMPTK